ncbi:MAG TPA: hypothetical protein VJ891_05215 [Casimicrobiaceae bacterium]|nr:hypothetical protein [Casimicrobiaceae bacterium]
MRDAKDAAIFELAFMVDAYEKGFHDGTNPKRARQRRVLEPSMLKYEPHRKRGYEDGRRAAEQAVRAYRERLEHEQTLPREPR